MAGCKLEDGRNGGMGCKKLVLEDERNMGLEMEETVIGRWKIWGCRWKKLLLKMEEMGVGDERNRGLEMEETVVGRCKIWGRGWKKLSSSAPAPLCSKAPNSTQFRKKGAKLTL